MSIQETLSGQFIGHSLRKRSRMQISPLLRLHQLANKRSGSNDPAEPHTRSHSLGKGAKIDNISLIYPRLLLTLKREQRRQSLAFKAQFGVWIIFYNEHA